jgi:hypothetical protein
MIIVQNEALPDNIGFKGLKKLLQDTLPEDTPCPYCNVIMERTDYKHPSYISIDHIIPYSRCQTHSVNNLIAACRSCNSIKSNKDSFKTFSVSKPQKLSSAEVAAIRYLMRNEWEILILEEVRVLILNKDFTSVKLYAKDLEHRVGSNRIYKIIKRILHLVSRPNDKFLLCILCEEYKIKQTTIKLKVLIETILDMEVEKTLQEIKTAKKITQKIDYKEIVVDMQYHFKNKK